MAYDPTRMSILSEGPGGALGLKQMVYDTTDAISTVIGAGYVSDARKKGYSVGSLVLVRRWTTTLPTTNDAVNGREAKPGVTAAAATAALSAVNFYRISAISSAGAGTLAALGGS